MTRANIKLIYLFIYIISECNEDTYGMNCGQNCNAHNCRDGTNCNHDDGHCPSGCQPGYMGDMCMEGQYHLFSYINMVLTFDRLLEYNSLIGQVYQMVILSDKSR